MAFDLLTIRNLHISFLKSEQLLVFIVWFLVFCKNSHVASHCTIWVNKIPSIVYWLTQSKPEYKGSNKPTKPASKLFHKIDQNYLKIVLKYYSPIIADGKTFVLVFCVLQIDSTQLLQDTKDQDESFAICNDR